MSSGHLPAAIAVVRISGPHAANALHTLIGKLPQPRHAMLARLRDPKTRDVIDDALVLWFPAPASETGEDVAELQVHGGRAVVQGIFQALGAIDGLRPAEAGEFTRRAFENGKLDLTAVEGLADLIAAETQAQRRQALRQLHGLLGARAENWRRRLIETLSLVEAAIDFSDEGDVSTRNLIEQALGQAKTLNAELVELLDDSHRGERLREGLVIAIAGPPNAGKSTLLNRLARRDAAIVSPYAGTTRDVIEVHLDLAGYPVTLLDTAGIRETDDPVEREGVARARARAENADLVLWVAEREKQTPSDWVEGDGQTWLVRNKIDAVPPAHPEAFHAREFAISALTGAGVDALLAALTRYAAEIFGAREPALITRERQRRALEDAVAALQRSVAQSEDTADILAEELRLAVRAFGRLTGRVDVEDVLDVIFRDFCIGK